MRWGHRLFYTIVVASCVVWLLNTFGIIVTLSARDEASPTESTTPFEVPKSKRVVKSQQSLLIDPSDNVEPIPRPKLRSIVQGWNISGDPSWLLQFSIVGFPKSGTSTLMFHLREHPEIHMFKDERCELGSNQHARLIQDLYRKFPASNATHRFIRGIKCPSDLETTALSMRNYHKFFAKTDFVVGIRHPVLWFESFYNFRVHNRFPMPPAEKLIGRCKKGWNFVCTYRSNFHIFLGNLGKTNLSTDPNEWQYVDEAYRKTMDPVPTARRIFLYEVSQLSDPDQSRAQQFRLDLQRYLHLQHPIAPFIWFKPGRNHSSNGQSTDNTDVLSILQNKKIDICDDRYDALRAELMRHAVQAATWLRKHFIHANGVVVSSKSHFANTILTSWKQDPCIARQDTDRQR